MRSTSPPQLPCTHNTSLHSCPTQTTRPSTPALHKQYVTTLLHYTDNTSPHSSPTHTISHPTPALPRQYVTPLLPYTDNTSPHFCPTHTIRHPNPALHTQYIPCDVIHSCIRTLHTQYLAYSAGNIRGPVRMLNRDINNTGIEDYTMENKTGET